ncbi:O-antigen polysaccharide polymerase Wzy [Nonlabens arenilitoris]|uniref:O-antigen polysaccharide polymerase Wzy n=1 Tax=Nonlabens arenilitoris TaxID=1217969 RepID=UPI0011B065CE|nr:O-antigen polysaccharide polymerase Wzy [Nonlabens arenilitoris]
MKKVLFLLPLAGVILCVDYYKNANITTQKLIIVTTMLLFLLGLLFLFKNPLTEKRNALGPIYLLLLFLFVPKLLNSNVKSTLLLFVVMIIGFPLSQFLTHIDYGFDEILSNPSLLFAKNQLSEGYMSLNYDAFINIGVVMEHVEFDGLSYGYQLLSALLFFVPRSLWITKPDASGLIVGNHVIDHYNFYFANLSNPYIAEGYMNFGIIGIIVMAIILALSIVYFLTWLNSSNLFKKSIAFYFAMHLLFLLRGDFTNGFSYFIGTLIGLYILPNFIFKFYHFIFKQKL